MRILSRKALKDFWEEYPDAKFALEDWYHRTTKAQWEHFADIKKVFNSVDLVGNDRYVFNIKGNHYRLIVIIRITHQKVFIRWVGTHKDYDKLTDIKNL